MDSLILKIAKKLKTFTLDDLIIMGDLDENLTTETMNKLVIEGKIKLVGKYFEYIEIQQKKENYKIIDKNIEVKNSEITIPEATEIFLDNIKPKVSHRTFGTYKSLFNSHIIPFFKTKKLKNIVIADIQEFKEEIVNKKLCNKKVKNTLALLNQLIKYFQNEGRIEKTCVFEVKRLEKEPKRTIQILGKSQIKQLFSILEKEYKYLLPVVEKVMQKKIKLTEILQTEDLHITFRRIRKDFFKIKQKLNLENFMFDDLRFSNFIQY